MSSGKNFETERSTVVRSGPDEVRSLIVRPATWPSWQPEILRTDGPDLLDEGAVVDGRAAMMGFEVDGKNVTLELGDRRIVHHAVVGVGMTITYEIEEHADGAHLTHRLQSDLPSGFFGKLLSFFLRARLRRMQREVVANLARQAEEPSA